MNAIDLSPFYRNSIGFDRLASLIDSALTSESSASGYPPYNIEMLDDSHYTITLAVAGFNKDEIDITVEKSVLTVRGKKSTAEDRKYLYQGIANHAFERKFSLADYVEVTDADIDNGMLIIKLVKEVPEAMKPRTITINQSGNVLEHEAKETIETSEDNAAA